MKTGWLAMLAGSAAIAAATLGSAYAGEESALAPGGGRHFGHGRGGDRLARELNLSDKQKTQWKQLREEHFQSIQPLIEQERQIHDQIRQQLEGASADPDAVGKLMIQGHELGKQFKASRDELDAKLGQILTPEQKTKFDAMKQRRMQGGPRGFRGHGFGGPDRPEPEPES